MSLILGLISKCLVLSRDSRSLKVLFFTGDYSSEVKAYKQAVAYRDNTFILGETNTGYKGIRVVKTQDDGLVVMVDKRHKHRPIYDTFPIDSNNSCTSALEKALQFLTKALKIGMPETIIYDYALYEAYKRGYKPHHNEATVVSPRLYIGAKIECPKTRRIGTVRAIYDEVSVWVSFEEGKPFETIVNEALYINKITTQVNKIEQLHNSLENNDLSDNDKTNIYNRMTDITNNMSAIYRQANSNKEISADTNEVKKIIHRTKRRVVVKRISK